MNQTAFARRGTILVLILGILALLSVITAAYVAIGKADRRTGAALRERQENDEIVEQAIDHVVGVISRDRTSGYWQRLHSGNGPVNAVPVREAMDYPWTDFNAQSEVYGDDAGPVNVFAGLQRDHIRFRPEGSFPLKPNRATVADPRGPSDPWLASIEPTYLGEAVDREAGDWNEYYIDDRDWAHISNFAPDGRYVNLWNLRPVVRGRVQPNFDAEPGVGMDDNGLPKTTMHLTLFDPESTGDISFTADIFSNSWELGFDLPMTFAGSNRAAHLNYPAHWTSVQRNMFRPMADNEYTWADPEYIHYQYADADGDGMADSRWIELVDTTFADDPREPRVEWIIPPDDRRYFFALRAVDLSALVNVNTATDFVVPPTNLHPSGATPADIDLRRLLINRDTFDQTLLTYADLQTPLGALTNVPGNYESYIFDFAADDDVQLQVGRFAYEAVQQANLFGAAPFTGTPVSPGWTSYATPESRRLNYEFFGRNAGLGDGGMFGVEDQAELMTYWGLNDPDVRSQLEQVMGGRYLALPNLSPLRDNRPASLERDSLDDQNNNGDPFANGQFAPDGMLDGNGAVLQATDVRRRLTTVSASSLQRAGLNAFTVPELGEAQGGTKDLSTAFDPARIDDPDRFDELDFKLNLHRFMSDSVFKQGTNPSVESYPLFRMYADLLLPWSGQVLGYGDTWEVDDENRSLHYGHFGPELALRFAAHLTANFIDSYDEDTTPSAFTVTARNLAGVPQNVNDEVLSPWLDREQVVRTETNTYRYGRRLDLDNFLSQSVANDRRRLARTPAPLISTERFNVYGIEAQPFLTEAASFVLYTDASETVGGDVDYGPEPVNPGDPVEEITINGDINLGGAVGGGLGDFAGMFVAFQLHNPFDVDIRLTSPTLGNGAVPSLLEDAFDFYIEFGGRFFRLAEYDSMSQQYQAITIRPNETIVAYATAVPHNTLDSRWDALARAYNPGADVKTSREWIREQLGADNGMRVVQIRQFNPRSGQAIVGLSTDLLDPINVPSEPESGSAGRLGTIQEVRLWRRLEFDGTGNGLGAEDQGGTRRNIIGNDQLVDRMVEPALAINPALAGILDQRLPPGQHDVEDTESFDESSTNADNDNTGFTLARYAWFRRPDGTSTPIRGAIPAWCIETKGGILNAGDEGPIGYGNLDDGDFGSGDTHTDYSFEDFIQRTPADIIIDTVGDDPADKSGESIGVNLYSQNYRDVTTEMGVDNREYEASVDGDTLNVLRIRDLLMPYAIGPESLPIQDDVTLLKHTTLSEWLSVIMGYDDCSDGSKWDPIYVDLPFIADPTSPATEREQPFLLDEGRLRLDRFLSFLNVDENIDPDFGVTFNPPQDLRVGTGVPMALGVYEFFAEPVWTDMGWNSNDDSFRDARIAGRINVNTASRQTLRSVPLLSPTYDVATPPGTSPRNATWWGPVTPLPGEPNTVPYFDVNVTGTGADIASSVVAYRDRQESVLFRAERDATNTVGNAVTFGDPNANPENPLVDIGRQVTSGIVGLREQPGIASIGELLMVSNANGGLDFMDALATDDENIGASDRTDLDGDGSQDLTSNVTKGDELVTLESRLHTSLNAANSEDRDLADQLTDEYDERLAILDGILNTVSVTSDTYAVWMVVHGYDRNSIEQISDPEEALVPDFRRRYLLIVDRSNVTGPSEMGRVLLKKELPF